MPSPGLGDVHIDAALTDFSTAYFQDPSSYVWPRLAPMVGTPQQSNRYFTYTKADLLRTVAEKRAPNTEAPVRNYQLSDSRFFCDVWSVAHDISEQVAANADAVLDPEQDAARLLAQDLNIRMDVEAASTFFATSIWGTDDTNEDWSDAASDPLGAISTGVKTVLQNTGFTPNTLILGPGAWYNVLDKHPDIIARLPDNAPRIATPEFIGTLAGIPNVIVAKSIRNSAEEGLTASYGFNFGAHCLLAYVDPAPGPRSPTAAVTFNWTGLLGQSSGIRTLRHEMAWKDALPRIEVQSAFDMVAVGTDLGYFISDVDS